MIRKLKRDQTYHFIGIGGIGMSAIAEMLVNLGFQVTGSDINKSYITQKLEEMGVQIFQGHEESHVHIPYIKCLFAQPFHNNLQLY